MKKRVLKSTLLLTAVLALTNLTGCNEPSETTRPMGTEQPTETAKPTEAPKPTETAKPTEDQVAKRKTEAEAEIDGYKDLTLYSEANQKILNDLKAAAKAEIEKATTIEAIDAAVDDFKAKADLVKTIETEKAEELSAYKSEKENEVASYKNKGDYRSEQQVALQALIDDAKGTIRACTSKEAVDQAVNDFKAKADLIKTKAVLDAEDLAAYKVTKAAEVEDYADPVNYRAHNATLILDLIDEYVEKVEAAESIGAIDSLMTEFKTKVDTIPVDSGFTGELDKGATVSFRKSEADLVSDLLIRPQEANWSGDGFAIRMKNLSSNADSFINVFLNETDSDRVHLATGAQYYLYNLTTGKKTAATSGRGWGYYINLPGDFDGYVYIPYSSMELDTTYGAGDKKFNYQSVYGLYLETNPFYDTYQNYQIGEVQTLSKDTITTVLQTSELTSKTYSNHFVKDYNGTYINLAFNGTDPIIENPCPFSGSLTGLNISFTNTEADQLSALRLIGQSADWSGDGIAIRFKNLSNAADSFISIFLNETDSDVSELTAGAEYTYYYLDGTTAKGTNGRGWGSYIDLPANFDGYIYLPYTSFARTRGNGDGTMTYNSMWGLYLQTNTHYDSYQNFIIGSMEVMKGKDVRKVIDTTTLTSETIGNYITKDTNGDKINSTFYLEA